MSGQWLFVKQVRFYYLRHKHLHIIRRWFICCALRIQGWVHQLVHLSKKAAPFGLCTSECNEAPESQWWGVRLPAGEHEAIMGGTRAAGSDELLQNTSGDYFIPEHFFYASPPVDLDDDNGKFHKNSVTKPLYVLGWAVKQTEAGFIINEEQEIIPTVTIRPALGAYDQ
ncbi:uncharacterized protein BJ212DRAFT_1301904 [Suillus subaureus]|uniref:Uncharacterized protein n=1 Tax=Suillus subaureus TaxID=48587 RepID=A0A9P7E4Z9_9AGAM|nr:uncharacterized protein BJ212DRAFT_1301904 [Suillus subaureus]KAG1811361.1 hypothetical protein BJ212DRAFT_1301904 [Suillus subaureus]